MKDGFYEFLEFKELLLDLKRGKNGTLNITAGFYFLLNEIENLHLFNSYLMDLVPLKYKKKFPKTGENPFIELPRKKINPKEYQEAKKRMASLLEDFKKNPMPGFEGMGFKKL